MKMMRLHTKLAIAFAFAFALVGSVVGCAVEAGDFAEGPEGEVAEKTQLISKNQAVTMVAIAFHTGGDDKRGGSEVNFQVKMTNNSVNTFTTDNAATWPNNSTTGWYYGLLPANTKYKDLKQLGVQMFSHNGFIQTNDNWNMDGFDLWVQFPNGTWSFAAAPRGNPLKRFTGDSQQYWYTWPAGT